MNRYLLPFAALLLAGCASTGTGPAASGDAGSVPARDLEPVVPPGGIEHPDHPGEPRLTELRRLTDGGQNAEAYFSPDGSRLIFQATMPGVSECDQQFVMGLGGQDLRRVSTGEGRTTCGYFLEGGDRIVYSSTHHVGESCPAPPDRSQGYVWALYDYDIYTAPDEGGEPERIFGSPVYDAEATLSPDGETVVFTSARSGDLEIYTMKTDGSEVRRLTHEVGYDGGPFFGPDGEKIVYRASHPEDPAAVADYRRLLEQGLIRPGELDVWVMDADGTDKVRVTDNGAANFGPFFHPSGEKIVFSSNMHDPAGREFDLYMVGVDGTGLERVTAHPDFDGFPMFNPADPTSFVFASNRGGDVEGETNVFLARWVEDPGPRELRAPVFRGDPAPRAHARAGVEVDPAPADTVSCPSVHPDSVGADITGYTGRYLSDDALEGRLAGSPGAACAAEYLARTFHRLGLAPAGEDGSYFQEVPLRSAVNPHAPGGTGRNVLGVLPGADRSLRDEYVVVGAHFDHLGMGGSNSLAREPGVHNGADDNASGVAAMLAAAERMAVGPRPDRSVVFMGFTGEESGLLGSAHWVENPTVPLEEVAAMINLDMVGRLEQNGLVVYGSGTAEEWDSLLPDALEEAGIEDASLVPDGYGASDQTSFYTEDIPVLHLFTNTHGDYHKPGDDWHKVDVEGVERIAGLVADVAVRVGGQPRLSVVPDVGAPEPGEDDRAATPGYGAYLGTIPDFTPVETGVLLSGVREGSPADEAGLRKGDVVVGIGGMEVGDLYDMTDALRAHAPGDTVVVEWLRDGERMRAETTLGSRD
jgi:Tol biopolymer transport system component